MVNANLIFATFEEFPEMLDRGVDGGKVASKSGVACVWRDRLREKNATGLQSFPDELLEDGSYNYVRCIHHHSYRGVTQGMHAEHRFGKRVVEGREIVWK